MSQIWDRAAVEAILPHGSDFVLVDRVVQLRWGAKPQLEALFHVPESHPILDAHFPEQPIWPGAYTIEGLAQSCMLLAAAASVTRWGTDHFDPAAIRAADVAKKVDLSGGRLARADVKFLGEIRPGDELAYLVSLASGSQHSRDFQVEASSGARLVARGRILAHSSGSPPP